MNFLNPPPAVRLAFDGLAALVCLYFIAIGVKPNGILWLFAALNTLSFAVTLLALITEKEDAK